MAKPKKSSFTLPAVPLAEKWEFSVEVEKELQYLSVQLKRDVVFEKTSTVMFVIEKSLSNLKELEYPDACVEYISAQFEKAISTRKAPPRSPQLINYFQKVKQLISEKLATAFQIPIELAEKKAEDIIDTVLKKHPLDKPHAIKNAFEYWTRQALSAAPEPETPVVPIGGAPVVKIKPTSKSVEVTPTPPLVPVKVVPTPPPEPPVPVEVPPTPPVEVVPIPPVEVAPTPPPEPPVPVEVPLIPPVEVVPTPPVEVVPTPPVEDLASMKKSIEERMEELKQEALIVNLKLQLEEERQKTDELKKRLSQTDGESPLVIKEEILIPPSYQTLVYMQPSDYEECRFLDFEGIIPGLKFEDLQQLSSHVGLSERMTGQEKDTIRELISKRMNEIRLGGL